MDVSKFVIIALDSQHSRHCPTTRPEVHWL